MTQPLLQGRKVSRPAKAHILVDGRPITNFGGFHYLGLADAPELMEAALRVLESGAGFSEALGSSYGVVAPEYPAVEEATAAFFGAETGVYFASGYLVGGVGLAALRDKFDVAFIDELAHWNLYDAARAAQVPLHVFPHADAERLETLAIAQCGHGARPLILTDGAFATTGRVPNLVAYDALAGRLGGVLFVDESHAYGVLGPGGRGAAAHCGAANALHGGTLSKAFSAFGAVMPCDADTAEALRRVPPLRGSAAGSPPIAAVAAAALTLALSRPHLLTRIQSHARQLHAALAGLGLQVQPTPAPIAAFQVGDFAATRSLQSRLLDEGVYVLHSNYIGTGPGGLIRCAVFADHAPEDIDALADTLRRCL